MKKLVEAKKDEQESVLEEKTMAIWDLGSPLYDSYELVALTHLIERHLMSLPSLGGSRRIVSKRISPAFDDDHHVVPAALLVSNMGSTRDAKRARSSSVSEFMRRKLWIMRKGIGYSRKDKPKKLIKAGHRGSCFPFGRAINDE